MFFYYSGMEKRLSNGKVLRLMTGDLTKVTADVLVNAANPLLAGGGGVDGAIHRAGGPSIMTELDEIRRRIGRCPAGSAVATAAGRLPAKFVFHAVGPVYRDGEQGEPDLLAACYRRTLRMAEEFGLTSIAFPSISTGAYGYPIQEAARIAVRTIREHLSAPGGHVREVTIVLFSRQDYGIYEQALGDVTEDTVE